MSRTPQTFANYKKVVPIYHFGVYGTLLLLLGTTIFLLTSSEEKLIPLVLFFLVICVVLVSFYSRQFALKVQDRAIRAEENFRYYILTGKPMPKVSMRQLISLRFASDEEFVALTDRVIKENLSPLEIKKAIRNWRPDYHRA